jgi:hypothetical protein
MPETRLLLVELVRDDPYRNFRSEAYPIIRGLAEDSGILVEWIVLGLTADASPGHPFVVDLAADDEETIRDRIGALRASHLLINEKLAGAVAHRLAHARSGLSILNVADVAESSRDDARALLDWLGLAERYRLTTNSILELLDHVTPSYASTPANPLASGSQRFIKVLCGPGCFYRRSLRDNPAFAGVDVSAGARKWGCSFCGQHGDVSIPQTQRSVVQLALQQIEAAARSLASRGESLRFMMMGSVAFLRIDEFVAGLLPAAVPPSAFFFSCRVDEFLSRAQTIRTLLPRLSSRGHSIHIHSIGVENFSTTENQRFNKGVSAEQAVEAFDKIVRLERDFPDSFAFHRHGGFSFILFTPWTTLEDLNINLRYARRVNVPADGFFFQSRLQVLPGQPIGLLAARDGLLTVSSEVPAYDSGCITSWDQTEIPWRFQHPEIGVLYSIISRWGVRREAYDQKDPGYRRIQAARAALPGWCQDTYNACELLMEVVRDAPKPCSQEGVLSRLVGMMAAGPRLEAAAGWETPPAASPDAVRLKVMRERLEGVLLLAKEQGLRDTFLLEGSPSPVAPGTVRIALGDAEGASSADAAIVCTARQRGERWQGYNLAFSMNPPGGTRDLRTLARIMSSQLLDLTIEGVWLQAEWSRLVRGEHACLDLIERAVFPTDGRQTSFSGFSAFWPAGMPTGETLLTLYADGSWIDLQVERRSPSRRCYASTRTCDVSYFNHTPLDTPAKRRALEVLVERIKELESGEAVA